MIAWIYTSDLEVYMQLMRQTGTDPSVMSQTDDKSRVDMTVEVANEWIMSGFWYDQD